MESIIEHKFYSEELFFLYPQGEEGKFFPEMLIKVQENQEAYLVEKKKVLKKLRIGTNSLTEMFSGFVVFLNNNNFQKKWGTLEPVPFKDKNFSLTYVKAYGNINFSIEDGIKFIERFIREKDIFLIEEFVDFLRNLIFFEFSNVLKEKIDSLSKQKKLRNALEDIVKENLNHNFEEIGLKLLDFKIVGGNIFEEKEKKEEKLKFCKNCSKEILKDANFCPYCGIKISNKCSSCFKEIPEYAKYCPFCGKKIT